MECEVWKYVQHVNRLSSLPYILTTYGKRWEMDWQHIQDNQHILYTPLYEGKMIYLYNHHYGINPLEGNHPNNASLPLPTLTQLQNTNFQVVPYYWVEKRLVEEKLKNESARRSDMGMDS